MSPDLAQALSASLARDGISHTIHVSVTPGFSPPVSRWVKIEMLSMNAEQMSLLQHTASLAGCDLILSQLCGLCIQARPRMGQHVSGRVDA